MQTEGSHQIKRDHVTRHKIHYNPLECRLDPNNWNVQQGMVKSLA